MSATAPATFAETADTVETRHLRDARRCDSDIARHVSGPIRIGGGSDGIAVGRDGGVYVTNVTLNRVQRIAPRTGTVATITKGPE